MTISKSFFALSILAALTTSLPAGADIPPDDACFAAMVGKPCSNAVGDGESSQPGTCGEATCTRATPDGTMTYTCYRCEAPQPGAGGQPNEAGAAGQASNGGSSAGSAGAGAKSGSGGASDDTESDAEGDGGCSVAQARGGAGVLGLTLAVLGVAVAGWRRRRLQRS